MSAPVDAVWLTREEVDDVLWYLDDADLIHTGARDFNQADRILKLWRRLHLWRHGVEPREVPQR
jgi:hypothetical protein